MNLSPLTALASSIAVLTAVFQQPQTPASVPATGTASRPAAEMSPEAAALAEKATTAAKAVKDLTCNVELIDKESPTVKSAKVILTFKPGSMFPVGNWRIDVKSEKAAAPGRVAAFDGTTIRTIEPVKKELQEMEAPQGMGFPMGEEGMFFPMWYMEQRQDDKGFMKPKIVKQVIEGTKEIGKDKVTVLLQVREMEIPSMDGEGQGGGSLTITTRSFLGSDFLARRVETAMRQVMGGEEIKQEFIQVYTDVKIDTAPGIDLFALKAPEGYTTKKVEADSGSGELTVKAGDAAIDFDLADADGKQHKLADFRGRVVLLDFWATWCGPCKQGMPGMQKLHETFAGKPVSIVGVNTFERKQEAGPAYFKKQGFTYLNLLKGDELSKAYGISGIPTMIVIGTDGKILHTAVGSAPDTEETLRGVIEKNLPKQ